MTGPRSTYVSTAGFEMHVTEWGERSKPALVMWHGLARTGRDFDEAAQALSDTYFVICPDTIGRGLSGWAKRPVRARPCHMTSAGFERSPHSVTCTSMPPVLT